MDYTLLLMMVGFVLAGYSIVANDAIQTLGTFLSSNAHRPWWVLWIFISSIFTIVLLYGWYANTGDVSYGRLEKFPVPEVFSWILIIPPLAILILTRFGIPVSTTFLILTVFAPTALDKMLTKSLLGYVLAFVVAFVVYKIVTQIIERNFIETDKNNISPKWTALQWASTGFLWSQWLIQDLANIFVYMPERQLGLEWVLLSILFLWVLHGVIIYNRGGAIQKIVTTKTNTTDIRSATIIDFIFGLILLFFKEYSNIPMSTTWVFLGLLAGRELAIALELKTRNMKETFGIVGRDAGKAAIGLGVSIAIAFGLPVLHNALSGPKDEVALHQKELPTHLASNEETLKKQP